MQQKVAAMEYSQSAIHKASQFVNSKPVVSEPKTAELKQPAQKSARELET